MRTLHSYADAVNIYMASERYITDAIEHLADNRGNLPDSLVAAACDLYRDSVEFDTVVEDLVAGEMTL